MAWASKRLNRAQDVWYEGYGRCQTDEERNGYHQKFLDGQQEAIRRRREGN
jgi:hypothetical protein